MSLVINTNVSSLNAQRQLVQSGNEMSQSMERLSSGRRINSAADDAAGLAIANRMTSQVRGLNQAIRNANDGVSMMQTAEGAMVESTNILQRMRELAIQAANGIYSNEDRSTLDAEVQQLKQELDRIAKSTTFNGQPLLDGTLGEVNLQVGAQANQTISLNIPAMDISKLGGSAGGDIIGAAMSAAPDVVSIDNTGTNTLSINGQNVGDLSSANNMKELLALFNENVSGVETTAFTEVEAQASGTGILRGANLMELTLHQLDGSTNTYQVGDTGSIQELADKVTSITGGSIKGSINDNGRLMLANSEGAAISVIYPGGAAAGEASTGIAPSADATRANAYQASLSFESLDDTGITIEYGAGALQYSAELGVNGRPEVGNVQGLLVADGNVANLVEGDVTINGVSIDGITATVGDAEATLTALVNNINDKSAEHGVVATVEAGVGGAFLLLNSVNGKEVRLELTGDASLTTTGLLSTNIAQTLGDAIADVEVKTAAGAQKAIEVIDVALEQINDTRSQMGAVSNRLDFTMSNLANVVENTSAARSRIVDADFAKETSELSRAQVLQQASQAMLAQANAQPQQVLQLLQG